MRKLISLLTFILFLIIGLSAQEHDHATDHQEGVVHEEGHPLDCSADHGGHHGPFDAGQTAFHHIADANVYSIGPLQIPLPCILYAPGQGFNVFMSSKFGMDALGHGDGHKAVHGYILDGGSVRRIITPGFPDGVVEHGAILHQKEMVNNKSKTITYVCHNGQLFKCDDKSKLDAGMFGGGLSSFYDFSLTKNVVSMILVGLLLFFAMRGVARSYQRRDGQAPKGFQSFMEPIYLFIQDEVSKPFLGNKWERFNPLIQALFFLILGLNLFGQIPFLGGSNVTGNLGFTLVLALFAFFVTNLNGNKHYWQHVLWMPGVPAWVKTILTPVEVLGLFIKPLTLMLRLFANITAGHMVIIIFTSLIFIFGNSGENTLGALLTAPGSLILSLFMMAIELLVAVIQAFVFAILTASYIGAAVEEEHH